MRRECVPREKPVDVAATNELAQGRTAACVDDRGAADNERFARSVAAIADEVAGDFLDEGAFWFLCGDAAGHECEVAADFGTLDGDHSYASVADDNRHALADLGHRNATRYNAFGNLIIFTRALDDDSAVHFLKGNWDPFAVYPNLSLLVRSAVKTFGKSAVHVGFEEPAVLFGGGDRTVVGDLGEDFLHELRRGGSDFDDRGAGIVASLADCDFGDAEFAPIGSDRVENLGQDEA